MIIDTHCHINMMIKKEFDRPVTPQELEHASTIIEQAQSNHVHTIINVGTNIVESENSIKLAEKYHAVYASVGIHPTDSTENWQQDFEKIKQLAAHPRVVAIGEIGLDFYHPGFIVERQQQAFAAQLELAINLQKAVVVHTRDAAAATLEVLAHYHHRLPRVVIHCFAQDMTFAETVIGWGMMIGIGGAVTYPKNEQLREIVRAVSLESIVLETDAPFLPPQNIRGKQNSPAQTYEIAKYIAELRGLSVDDVAAVTTATARRLFGI